MKKLNKLLPNL